MYHQSQTTMESKVTNSTDIFSWTHDLVCQYDNEGILKLAEDFGLSEAQSSFFHSAVNTLLVNPVLINRVLAMIGIQLTEGLIGALLYNLASENQRIDVDELLVDAVAMERYLMYNNCRENSDKSSVQRASKDMTSRILKHVLLHSKTLNTPNDVQSRYMETLLKIPDILTHYISAVKSGKTLKVLRESCHDHRPKSPFLLAPIYPADYPPVGERNQDTFELREKRRKKLRLKWSQIASPCQLKNQHLKTMTPTTSP